MKDPPKVVQLKKDQSERKDERNFLTHTRNKTMTWRKHILHPRFRFYSPKGIFLHSGRGIMKLTIGYIDNIYIVRYYMNES